MNHLRASKSPLCVFSLSPPFSPRAFQASRRSSVRGRRRDTSLSRFSHRSPAIHRRRLTLQELLQELTKAWLPNTSSELAEMEKTEMVSPVLLRRRLSAPETVMRKHSLAQRRSESQDGGSRFGSGMETGSETNLYRRKESDLMRKNTLLKRLWNQTHRFSGAFNEWQHSFGKLSSGRSVNSITSLHSSPEHVIGKRSVNEGKRSSPKHISSRGTNLESGGTGETSPRYSTTFSGNSDSAYTNSRSNFSTPSVMEIRKDTEVPNQDYISGKSGNETSTQTSSSTNVNVISNIQLSQSTLDLIFDQVMKDVKIQPIDVKPVPSFYLKRKDSSENLEPRRIVKCMISNVGVGSTYSKPQMAVPRFSARPNTSSMEVNISSGESTDRESDTVSLVDSLEDACSLKTERKSGDTSLELPDNSKNTVLKPTAFFIPIQLENGVEIKAVSEHLPEKVKNKLFKRHQKREEKNQSRKNLESNENGNLTNDVNSNNELPEVNYGRGKKRNKPLLPSIESFRKTRIEREKIKRKITNVGRPQWTPRSRNKHETLSPVYDYSPKRVYHKTEFNTTERRIEILEIMECVEKAPHYKSKSKIPVFVNKLPKINQRQEEKSNDPKLDQLIANILIDTLNIPDKDEDPNDNEPKPESSTSQYQRFEAIPEEQSVENDVVNNNKEKQTTAGENPYQGKAAIAVVKDENFSSIPKGWITFYMLHNNKESPESTSDEGKWNDFNSNSKKAKGDPPYENYSSSSEMHVKPPPNGNRYKKYSQRKVRQKDAKQAGGWSVTVSGTNAYGPFAPNLEMCVRFPDHKNCNYVSQSDSGVGEDNEQKFHFPKIENRSAQCRSCQSDLDPLFSKQRLPNIERDMAAKQQKSDSSTPQLSSRIEPRQTRTSTRRYQISRPKIEYTKIEAPRSGLKIITEKHYAEILRRFPEILAISGNAISQEKK